MFKHTLYLIIFLLPAFMYGQTERDYRKALGHAELHFESKEYAKAIPYLEQIKDAQHGTFLSDAEFNFMLGTCYWNVDSVKTKAIPHLEKYLEQSHEETEAEWWLAELYIITNNFDKAMDKLKAYIEFVEADDRLTIEQKEKEINSTKREIISCQYAKQLIAHPIKAEVMNLGDSVNTIYAEYAPVIDNNEKLLYFTRKSPDNISHHKDKNGNYYEEIFLSKIRHLYYENNGQPYIGTDTEGKKLKLQFSNSRNVGKPVNHALHDAAVQLSHNDEHLFILRDNHVWRTVRVEEIYTEPIKFAGLEGLINSGSFIPSLSINKTEDLIYFSCDKTGGYGGLDLYMTQKVNDIWQEPVNLGERINTEFDEDAPYIDPDGHTLYFSSKGHSSMGGYDIFKSYMGDEGWTFPHNLGYPVNSAADDIFYMMPEKDNRAYFSSNRPGGKGLMDIYEVTFNEHRDQLAEIRGTILVGEALTPATANLSVIDDELDQSLAHFHTDSTTGDYHVLLHHNNKYKVKVEVNGYAPYIQSFDIPEKMEKFVYFNELQQKFVFTSDQVIIGQQIKYLVPVQHPNPDSGEVYMPIAKEVFFYFQPDSIVSMYNSDKTILNGFTDDYTLFFPKKSSTQTQKDTHYFEEVERVNISKLEFEPIKGFETKAELMKYINTKNQPKLKEEPKKDKPKKDKTKKDTSKGQKVRAKY